MSATRFQEQEYQQNFNLKLWKDVLRQAIPFKKHVIMLSLVMTATGGIDAIFPLLSKYAIDHFITPKSFHGLPLFGLFYFILLVINATLVFFLIALAGRIETGMNNNLRKGCYRKLQELSFTYYDKTPTGWVVARVVSDISRLGDVVAWGIVDTVWGIALMIGIMIAIFSLNWHLALLVITVVPVLLLVSGRFHITILRQYRQVRKLNSQITGSFNECIHGARTTKTLVREDANLAEFQTLNTSMYGYSVRAAVISALFMPTVMVISAIGTGLIIWQGGNAVLAKTIGYGTFVAFIGYTFAFFEPVSHVARMFAELQNAQAAAERVFSLLQMQPDIVDHVPYDDTWAKRRLQGSVDIDNITFAYKENRPIFQDFSLSIPQGQSLALVGETGTGKTTLVNLICRFYEVQQGSIAIDGINVKQVPMKWIQSHLGYVQQVPHLFQGTIRDNIRYGKLTATEDEIREAARLVHADEFISTLPGEYDYQVGESGSLLSTGQKQLIAFARVVLANPSLLILDEATASIDTETEQLVQDAIQLVLKGRTSIIVAHRLSTIRQVDRILLLHKGKIVEEGNHHSLMQQKGQYHALYMNQFVMEESEKILSQ